LRYITLLAAVFLFWPLSLWAENGEGKLPNILLLTVDSFRPDRLGCYGAEGAQTPNIDRLAAGGVLFTRAYSTASWTNASLVSLLTALYPSVHGVQRRGESVPEELVTPLELLAEAGYFVPEINYLFPMPNYRNLGFTPNPHRDLVDFLAGYRDTTFFAWYHFHGPHLPYNPPPKYLKKFLPASKPDGGPLGAVLANVLMPRGEYTFSPREQTMVKALYDAEVAAQDEEIGRVLDALEELGLRKRTIVILTADHGEELFDHGWLGHASTSLSGTLYEELVHIPLIVSWPAHLKAGTRVDNLVQGVDLMPTLFELVGLELSAPHQGHSFAGLLNRDKTPEFLRETIFCETSVCGYQCPDSVEPVWLRCVRTDRAKLIQKIAPGERPSYSFFDLVKDPGEQHEASATEPEEMERLKGMLLAQVFRNLRLREALVKGGFAAGEQNASADIFEGVSRVVVSFPAEGERLTYSSHGGKVPVSWSGPERGEYIIEYVVGRGKYHLEGSFPVRGNRQTFGPFNPVFWRSFRLYNPWRFRVIPKGRPDLASAWRSFEFE